MTFKPDSNASRLPPNVKDRTGPLWSYTQQRLQAMETWSARHRSTESGSCERIQLQDERIALASRHLVLLLKEWEERTKPFDSNKTTR